MRFKVQEGDNTLFIKLLADARKVNNNIVLTAAQWTRLSESYDLTAGEEVTIVSLGRIEELVAGTNVTFDRDDEGKIKNLVLKVAKVAHLALIVF